LQESLKACPHQAANYAFKVSAVVRPTARVSYRGIEYSVPAALIGQTVTLHLQEQQVQIYQSQHWIASHRRCPENGRSSILADHAEELFVFRRGKPYAQRQLLLELDSAVEPYLTELVHRRPQSWEVDIDRLYQLYRQVGQRDFLAALALATEQRCFGSEYLIAIAADDAPPRAGLAAANDRRWS
jgi:ribosomal protein S27AE